MKEELCREAEDATKNQYQNPLWNRLRFSRITESVLDQASKCRTVNGSLVNLIQGAKLRVATGGYFRDLLLVNYL
ncbi:Uncharacterized protein APZ42_006313 [Daphnia magna]|uniref:Uncharacterized protein n=1 Tax=Daphnia magna TaxID=35525 RepID=A0A162D3R3_9CRUS|nr:Uncharacterized protein APZ42_006313 [Daphnia magna]